MKLDTELVVSMPQTGRRPTPVRIMAGLVAAVFVGLGWMAQAQRAPDTDQGSTTAPALQSPDFSATPIRLQSLPRNLFMDQKQFWSSPFHMTDRELQWTVPLVFAATALVASDTSIEKHAPSSLTTISHASTASNAGLAAYVGAGGGLFVLGHMRSDDQQRETGLLSGEAAIDAFLDTEVFKYAAGRERPYEGDHRGGFFQGGSSFPSEHASISWAIASVIAHEYPGPLTQILAYGLAGGIGVARFAAQQHFASDVVIGSALGWYTGRQVFRAHSHYSDAEIARFGTFNRGEDEPERDPGNMASSYVPLDSWVYPAVERLLAMGYIHSGDLGMRPWTRMECARLLQEAAARLQDDSGGISDEPQKIYTALAAEFSEETGNLGGAANLGANLDSVYTRITGISGTPLRDGLHFGQTIVNDYGRPYADGFNNVTGFAGRAQTGPFSFFVRTEYQHAPSFAALSQQARDTIAAVDTLPSAPPDTPAAAVNRMDLLEGYIGVQFNSWQLTFGKQALWWGPDESGPMLLSNNAAPILMLQINRVRPFNLPLLGAIRVDYFIGRLSGYHWTYSQNSGYTGSWTESLSDQPFIVGQKVSFKPSSNLELGISTTSLFAGPGVPATLHKLLRASYSTSNGDPGTSGDPGDRRGGFDFAYRVPKLRDWLTFYGDAFTDDQANPWLAWDKTALTSGLYLSRVPAIPKLDFRVEGVYTDLPGGTAVVNHGFFYINSRFKSGYTNDGNLIGSWIGRQGQGADAWSTYWFTPRNRVQLHFRHQKVSREFIPNGGTLTDIGASTDYWMHSSLGLSASVQYERWLFPVIQLDPAKNVAATVQLLFAPHSLFQHSAKSAGSQP